MLIRPVVAGDDLDSLLMGKAGWPGAERVAALLAGAPQPPSGQLVAVSGESLVGHALCLTHPLREGGRALVRLWMDPQARRRGVGSRLWQDVLEMARGAGLPGVLTVAPLDDARSLELAAAHGLATGDARLESRLDLAALPNEVVRAAVAQVELEGLQLVPLELADPDSWRRLYQAFLPLHRDTPDGRAGREPPSLEWLQAGYSKPWQVLLARRGDTIVGMTLAYALPDAPLRVWTFFTGVDAGERGKGLATALKAEHAGRLREAGWRELHTWNMASNQPILAANDRLGFVRVGGLQELTFDFANTATAGAAR